LAFFILVLRFGPQLFAAVSRAKYNLMRRGSQLGYLLAFLLVMSLLAMTLGVNVMFGAFVAGMAAAHASEDAEESRKALKDFSSAFFIPIYFAIVGLKLDLFDFPLGFFLVFTLAACVVKAASVWLGAKIAGCSTRGAWNLAVAMNARGGPGIVLASLAYDARIVNEKVYVVLVLLAILTSLLAGAHLRSHSSKRCRTSLTRKKRAGRRARRAMKGRPYGRHRSSISGS
jgi:Kef-type K+ transport system membrane component KefB